LPRRIGTVLLRPRAQAIHRGNALTPTFAATRIDKFIAHANQLAARHQLDHEMIPEDPYGPINLSRLRRTVAWFINRLPGGRVALGIQYGHLRLTMSESYSNRSRCDLLELLDLEQARTTADTLADAADRLHHAEGVSGPATDRYLASAREYRTTYAGSHLSTRQHRALLANPKLKVFDHPQAFLVCNDNPVTALCDPERGKPGRASATPSHDRCDRACANIARTDTHIAGAQAEIERLNAEIGTDADSRTPSTSGCSPAARHYRPSSTLTTPPGSPSRARDLTMSSGNSQPAATAQIAATVAELLTGAPTTNQRTSTLDGEETVALTQAMARLLLGTPLRSDGKPTVKSLATEAGLRRNKLTHKHTGLKDLFYALVKTHHYQPAIVVDLHDDNDQLRQTITELRHTNHEQAETINGSPGSSTSWK
jgi:hypothetical protein